MAKAQKEAFYFTVAGLASYAATRPDAPAFAAATGSATIDPFFNFNPVCPASDGVFRVGQRAALGLAGADNIENYRPLINDVLIRVRTEQCVLESFSRETALPFIREKDRVGSPVARDERDVPRGRRVHGGGRTSSSSDPPRWWRSSPSITTSRWVCWRAGRGRCSGWRRRRRHGEARREFSYADGRADGGGEGADDGRLARSRDARETHGGGEREVLEEDGGDEGGGGRAPGGRGRERVGEGARGGRAAIPLRLYGRASGVLRQGLETFDTFCSRYFVAFTVTYIIIKTAHYVFFPNIFDASTRASRRSRERGATRGATS